VAESLDMSLVTDAVGVDTGGGLTVTREFYGGKTEGEVDVFDDRAVVTIREGEWDAPAGAAGASIQAFDADIDETALGTTVNGFEEAGSGDVDITEADVLVSVGRGIDEEDNIPLMQELADAMGATLSSSRPIVDNGWLPQDRQVGQSGKKVTPDVYIAIGISGAVQHVAGMKGADTIIAINTDPGAPIFDIADYGIVDDLFDVVPRTDRAVRVALCPPSAGAPVTEARSCDPVGPGRCRNALSLADGATDRCSPTGPWLRCLLPSACQSDWCCCSVS
jgi:Electron transfer flavoprotein, alpha subunit